MGVVWVLGGVLVIVLHDAFNTFLNNWKIFKASCCGSISD